MEINEATCLCRFGASEVLGDGTSAESNYWSVTSAVECRDAKSGPLAHGPIYTGQQRHASVQTRTLKHMFCRLTWITHFMRAWWVSGSGNKISSSPIHHLHAITQKTHSSSETVGPPGFFLSACLWSGSLSHTYAHSHTLCSMPHPHC